MCPKVLLRKNATETNVSNNSTVNLVVFSYNVLVLYSLCSPFLCCPTLHFHVCVCVCVFFSPVIREPVLNFALGAHVFYTVLFFFLVCLFSFALALVSFSFVVCSYELGLSYIWELFLVMVEGRINYFTLFAPLLACPLTEAWDVKSRPRSVLV